MSSPTASPSLATSDPITRGLLFLALINEGSGTTLKDLISGNNATIPAGWTWGSDATEGNYVSGVGTQAPITWAINQTGKQFNAYSLLTVGHWNGTGNQTLFGYGHDTGGGSTSGWGIQHTPTSETIIDMSGATATSFSHAHGSAITAARYLTVRRVTQQSEAYSGSGATAGDTWSSGSGNVRQDTSPSTQQFTLGASNTDTTAINGWVSFIALWNRALIASEITRLMANPLILVGQGAGTLTETVVGGGVGSIITRAYGFAG